MHPWDASTMMRSLHRGDGKGKICDEQARKYRLSASASVRWGASTETKWHTQLDRPKL